MRDVYIVEAVRSPIGRGREDGALHPVYPVKLMATVLEEVVRRAGVDKGDVEDVICGCVSPTNDQGANIARLSLLKAGFPIHVPGVQIDRMCGSGQQAVHFGSQAIAAGDVDLVIAGGVEMMSRVPMTTSWDVLQDEEFVAEFPFHLSHMGVCAELLAEKWNLSRRALDEFAAESHRRAARARENGYFRSQIVPIEVELDGERRMVDEDEGIRPNPDVEKLATLKTPFKEGGVVSAATASQVSDGAAAILLASGEKANALGLRKRARIVARVSVGSDPELTLTGPIAATEKTMNKAGLSLSDMDVIEINEAFATAVLAWKHELNPDMAKVNPNGGAIAMGHPLGATGAVLMTKLVHELERTGTRYGFQTMCIGHGQATGTIIERVS